MKRYLTELTGTFFLVLTIGLTAATATPFAAFAIGAILMVMVYMGGHVSGAHYNPAVSFALMLRGALPRNEFVPYAIAQIVGAVAAAAVSMGVSGRTFVPVPAPGIGTIAALAIEVLFTFALCLVVLNVAVSTKTKGNSFYGLAIGFTVAAGAAAGGPFSGGAFNPAVGLGPALVHALARSGAVGHVWLYLVGPLVGGALATWVFQAQEEGGA